MTRYATIYADPAWTYETWSEKGKDRGACQHYETMTLDELKALPVADVAARDCALLMWTTKTHWPQPLELGAAWGFTWKTRAFLWAKTYASGAPFMGGGHWTRANPEDCLLFTRGRPKRLNRDVEELIIAPVSRHSSKPIETYRRIERLVAGPYLELFARNTWPGWDAWGNEVGLKDGMRNGGCMVDLPGYPARAAEHSQGVLL